MGLLFFKGACREFFPEEGGPRQNLTMTELWTWPPQASIL